MKDQILDKTQSVQVGNNLAIPIADVSKLFGTKNIPFQISIKNNIVVLESPKILVDLDIQDELEQETTIID